MSRFTKSIVVDTGFWFALFDPRDQYHAQAGEKENVLAQMNVLVPWPSLYETINTRFCKKPHQVVRFESLLRQPHFLRIDDTPYRDKALEITLRWSKSKKRVIALADMVIRLVLDDITIKKDALLTFNAEDFIDVCRTQKIELL
ncbi:MAG TPA: hypothetical protein PLI09_23940 [Candidatus Hydrogenedentes bacterium]|nr:hypothetical protein [Candidatus Hydrogenedentota bacterium]